MLKNAQNSSMFHILLTAITIKETFFSKLKSFSTPSITSLRKTPTYLLTCQFVKIKAVQVCAMFYSKCSRDRPHFHLFSAIKQEDPDDTFSAKLDTHKKGPPLTLS